MTQPDARQVVSQVKPTTTTARLRSAMPEIERKLAEGVRLAQIHRALTDIGFELTLQTLKTYLYRYRKKHGQSKCRQPSAADVMAVTPPPSNLPADTPRKPLSMQELHRMIHPDPSTQAEELAYYERLGKQLRKNRNT